MATEYSAYSHDWDYTLKAAHDLLMAGQIFECPPNKGTLRFGFSSYAGSMLLSFCAIESFSASVAFLMPNVEKFKDFDFEKYRRCSRFWEKIEMLCGAIPIEIDKSQGMFQKISEMQQWRNLITHASPYEIPPTLVENTVEAPKQLHAPFKHRSYPKITNVEHAKEFYTTAFDYITLVKKHSGINPVATVSYKVG